MENKISTTPLCHLGRPDEYTEKACEAVIKAASEGAHVAGMILAAGAKSRTTFYSWQKKYPEFKEACDFAKLLSQAYYERLGEAGISGQIKNFNASAWIMVMNNKFPEDYNRAGNASGTNTTNITFNTLNMSDEQKKDRIKGLLEKLNTAGKDIGQVYDAIPED